MKKVNHTFIEAAALKRAMTNLENLHTSKGNK